jgi:class 3 adenylate cyclase/TolB-like protein
MSSSGERRLSAIMFTDLVGYTKMMQSDEEQAHRITALHRDIIEKTSGRYNGKVLKYIGDGSLLTFRSAKEAVDASIEIQNQMVEQSIELRIGIHVGDIVFEDDGEVYGDGVNVASRIEPVAPTSGICISNRVFADIQNHGDIQAVSIGYPPLKNVSTQIEVYGLLGLGLPSKEEYRKKTKALVPLLKRKYIVGLSAALALFLVGVALWQLLDLGKDKSPLTDRDLVVVLPFTNLTGDDSHDIWGEGISEMMISDLSRSEEIRVLDRSVVHDVLQGMNYSPDQSSQFSPSAARELAKKTAAKTIVSGSIMQSGDQIRLEVKLQDSQTGEVVLSESLLSRGEDVYFDLVPQLTGYVRNYLEIEMLEESIDRDFYWHGTESAEAFRYYINGTTSYVDEDVDGAIEQLNRAINIDSTYWNAYTWLGIIYGDLGRYEKAAEYFTSLYDHRLEMNPPESYVVEWFSAFMEKDPENRLKWAKRFVEYSPESRIFLFFLSESYKSLNMYSESLETIEKIVELNELWEKPLEWTSLYEELCYLYLSVDRPEDALNVIKSYSEHLNPVNVIGFEAWANFKLGNEEKFSTLIKNFRTEGISAGLPITRIDIKLADIHREIGKLEEAEIFYRSAIKSDPNNPDFIYYLSYFLIDEIGDSSSVDEGLIMINNILADNPKNILYLYTHGLGLYKSGRYSEAVDLLKTVNSDYPFYRKEFHDSLVKAQTALSSDI